jgi:hypothetical protein
MKYALALFLYFLRCPHLIEAQEPRVAATGREFRAGIGLAYLNFDAAPSSRSNLLGLMSQASIDLSPKLGVEAEVGYLRASNVFGAGHHSDILTYLAGPVWYPTTRGFQPYLHGLVGLARVTGPIPLANEELAHGMANKLAWELGTGVELRLHGPMRVRIGADYLHTAYYGPLLQIRGQSNVKMTASIDYVFGIHRDR